jgi:hypothetical protein
VDQGNNAAILYDKSGLDKAKAGHCERQLPVSLNICLGLLLWTSLTLGDETFNSCIPLFWTVTDVR